MSPTARTLVYLRRSGFLAVPVERYIPQTTRKVDLFGVGDVLAVHPVRKEVLIVQATSRAHLSDRLRRVQQRHETALLLRAGVAVEAWGWFQRPSGKWEVHRVVVQADSLDALPMTPRRRRASRQPELF